MHLTGGWWVEGEDLSLPWTSWNDRGSYSQGGFWPDWWQRRGVGLWGQLVLYNTTHHSFAAQGDYQFTPPEPVSEVCGCCSLRVLEFANDLVEIADDERSLLSKTSLSKDLDIPELEDQENQVAISFHLWSMFHLPTLWVVNMLSAPRVSINPPSILILQISVL